MTRTSLIPFVAIALITTFVATDAAAQDSSVNPHGTLPADLSCTSCHRTDAWSPLRADSAFDHGTDAGFSLTGRHEDIACASCHNQLRFSELEEAPATCSTCHSDVHGGSISTSCSSCHSTQSFADVDGTAIHAGTLFPISGAHLGLTCESCHVNDLGGAYTIEDSSCFSCHESDYRAASAPDHAGSGFPTTCATCHSDVSWEGAEFDHAAMADGYALLGAHEVLACASCHTMPSLEPLFAPAGNQDCATCHAADYETAHAGSGFPTTCATCHTEDNWDADMEDHDQLYFPIYSGDHRGEWSSCQTCHTVPENFQVFSCLTCHEHNQTKMDDVHSERRNYVYDSLACYSCHPGGDS